jgi:hypothetical protein
MLYENDVVEAVCTDLQKRGFVISQRRLSTERGDDIVAIHPSGFEFLIEAKGETSARTGSGRYGNPFDRGQVLDHVSQAFYRAAAMLCQTETGKDRSVGIALPDNANHRERIDAIQDALRQLNIAVFWVKGDGGVTVSTHASLPEKPFRSKIA